MLQTKKIILLISLLSIGCVSTSKYEDLKKTCEDNEKKLQDELALEKNNSASRELEYKNELKDKQDKFNEVLRERISLRSSVNQMEGSVDDLTEEKK